MKEDTQRILRSIIYPAIFVILIWLVYFTEEIFHVDLSEYGLQPLKWKGLIGIFTTPLLHANFSHLVANSIPLLILGSLLFYFYREIAWRVVLLIWLLTGLWTWFLARGEGVHIGASGLVYGFASFLFFSGILRRDNRLMAITLLIAFLYGGMVWGIFPRFFPNIPISWESHLMGMVSGLVLAFYYRRDGPQPAKYDWEDEPDDGEDGEDNEPWNQDY
ncbi:MAG TPA: rhomboid family intramembrane serine protease [Bacteroidales bacterium]|nr:rhomboid family intramembrane serine protease [Bacteroidales bacterium]